MREEAQKQPRKKIDPVSTTIIGATIVAMAFMVISAIPGASLFGEDRRQLYADDIVVLDTSTLINDAGEIQTEEDLSAKEVRKRIEEVAREQAENGKIVIRNEYIWDAPEENIIPIRF